MERRFLVESSDIALLSSVSLAPALNRYRVLLSARGSGVLIETSLQRLAILHHLHLRCKKRYPPSAILARPVLCSLHPLSG